ncbi:MAG: NAD-dependent epimerase/dehydratase family protein [Chloroflexi bacterium]|nr:MAG: NAD-dependent epimerase/dehydratase family protein [Chloroflexota bacterium]
MTRYPNRTSFIKEDVRNASALPEHVRGQDAILHLAGQVAVTTSLVDPGTDFDVNARGTLNMLEAVRLHNHDAPFLFASTNKVYGKLDENNSACKETQPIDFHSPYGCSKGAADQYVRDYARCFHMNTVVLRQSCIYGDVTQVRDLPDARDLSALYAIAIDKIGITRGEIYNVGGGAENQRNLLEVIDQIGELTGRKPQFSHSDWREGDQKFYVSDITKANNDLGWTPQIPFERGLRELISWAKSVN